MKYKYKANKRSINFPDPNLLVWFNNNLDVNDDNINNSDNYADDVDDIDDDSDDDEL